MAYILLKESSKQFYMHFREAYRKPCTINITILSEFKDNERRLSRLLYHVPVMCNAKLHDTHRQHWANPHTHTALG